MIDERATLIAFGYTSDELKPKSRKPIISICDICGEPRKMPKASCHPLCISCSNTGERNPQYGKHISDETKKKISQKNVGEGHWNWRGGMAPWRCCLYQSSVYKNWRKAVFERDDYTCQMCNVRGGDLQAHHIRQVSEHRNDLAVYDVDNGITLCKKCHQSIRQHEGEFVEEFENMIKRGEN